MKCACQGCARSASSGFPCCWPCAVNRKDGVVCEHPAGQQSAIERARELLGTPGDVLVRHGVAIRGRMARCPMHDDSAPSLSLYTRDGRQKWKCHAGCGGGDAIDLEARLRGITVRELLRELSEGARA